MISSIFQLGRASSVKRGERNISLLNIESLAHALGVKTAELMPDWPRN
jgi:hypothetical protein